MKKSILFSLGFFIFCAVIVSCKKGEEATPVSPTSYVGNIRVGQSLGGGVVFYVDQSGEHGLVVDTLNQIGVKAWCAGTPAVTNATSTALGMGDNNSEMIVNSVGTGNYAALACEDLVLNGFDDWFLPSKEELNLLYQQKVAGTIHGLPADFYWSSSETSTTGAWSQSFMNGSNSSAHKSGNYGVCAVRAF